jgi:hypothetical protein
VPLSGRPWLPSAAARGGVPYANKHVHGPACVASRTRTGGAPPPPLISIIEIRVRPCRTIEFFLQVLTDTKTQLHVPSIEAAGG